MAHKFHNKLGYPLEIGHAYLVRLISTKPVKEKANVVMFYLGEIEGHPAFTPILDDEPVAGHEAVLDHTIFTAKDSAGSVNVIGRFVLKDCDPSHLGKSKEQKVKPSTDEDTLH